MRTITVKIPRLPAVEPAAAALSPGPAEFGPLGWQWASQGDDGDEATVFAPLLELVHVRIFNLAIATCPGAVSWRLDPEPGPGSGYALSVLTGAVILEALDSSSTVNLYAISATGAELGPITLEAVS